MITWCETSSLSRTTTTAGEEVLGAAASWLKERVDAIESKPKSNKPNVFFLYIDDLGWNDIGYQSSDLRAMTPNLNRMAEGGVTVCMYVCMFACVRMYVYVCVCGPVNCVLFFERAESQSRFRQPGPPDRIAVCILYVCMCVNGIIFCMEPVTLFPGTATISPDSRLPLVDVKWYVWCVKPGYVGVDHQLAVTAGPFLSRP